MKLKLVKRLYEGIDQLLCNFCIRWHPELTDATVCIASTLYLDNLYPWSRLVVLLWRRFISVFSLYCFNWWTYLLYKYTYAYHLILHKKDFHFDIHSACYYTVYISQFYSFYIIRCQIKRRNVSLVLWDGIITGFRVKLS